MRLRIVLALLLVLLAFRPAAAFEPVLMKESVGADANLDTQCLLTGNTNGTAANYRWYNLCSGYIWVYGEWENDEGVGVLFGGPEQPAVTAGNVIKRVITYYRNTVPEYCCRVEVSLERDNEADGCPDGVLAAVTQCPQFRWNCAEFGLAIPATTPYIIVGQTRRRAPICRSGAPGFTFVTDGPFSAECDPNSPTRSFYYGINNEACIPWVGPDGDPDNFLTWLIIDGEIPNATAGRSWGSIKGLFR